MLSAEDNLKIGVFLTNKNCHFKESLWEKKNIRIYGHRRLGMRGWLAGSSGTKVYKVVGRALLRHSCKFGVGPSRGRIFRPHFLYKSGSRGYY